MILSAKKKCLILLTISSFYIITSSCNVSQKIPVTTNSKEALKYYKIGLEYADKLLMHEARNHFETAIVLDSSFALAYLGLATSSSSTQKNFEYFKKAKAQINNVSEGEKLWILAIEAGRDGLQKKQNEYYQELVNKYPNDERAHALLGQSYYFGLQEYEKSIASYKKAIAINPGFSPSYNIIGYAYRTLGRYDEAQEALKKYIKLIPDEANPYDSYAELLLKIGKYDESIKYYKKALAVDPSFQMSYSGIAANLVLLGQYEEARDKLQILIDKAINASNKRLGFYSTALTYVDEANLDLALKSIDEIIKLDKGIEDTTAIAGEINLKGLVLLEFEQYDEALDQFKESIQLVRNSKLDKTIKENSELYYAFNRFSVALRMGDIDSAYYFSNIHQNLSTQIDNQFLKMRNYRIKGLLALSQNDLNNALLYFEKSNQQNALNIYYMALINEGLGRTEKAKELYYKAAHFNAVNDYGFWLIRRKALQKFAAL